MIENTKPEGEVEPAAASAIETESEASGDALPPAESDEGTVPGAPGLAIDPQSQEQIAAAMQEAEQSVIDAVRGTAQTLANVSRALD
ncbi:hypothetical protein [Novosphingobium beihaiensis]|uniref:Uncharacterized protein n=1 Tax=Novosphingobium beihaiensis TaxID=2930389 RepID=A0ABT0BJY2_9SPHN|nr:hypothetical protein [Novosphingobium beihaiensis]MCJ2185352.1 hypothetical protein [Novosphingobium beihaiensis]